MCCGPLSERLPSAIVDTEKVLTGSGWVRGAGRGETARGWKGVRPGVRLESRTVRAGEEPEERKRYEYFRLTGANDYVRKLCRPIYYWSSK